MYFVFSDEAGCYVKRPNETHRNKHPFYIRSNVMLSADDYRVFQGEVQGLNERIGLPCDEEIKWSDLGRNKKKNPRTPFIGSLHSKILKGYCREILRFASEKPSLKYIFTVTDVRSGSCHYSEDAMLKCHLQEVFQRAQMDVRPDGFAVVIMDELNGEKMKTLKQACHNLTTTGDFIKEYANLYHGVVTENSAQSAGIQLADFAAGVMNGYLRRCFYQKDNYEFAEELFSTYVRSNIRQMHSTIIGYGVRPVPNDLTFRNALSRHFEL